MKTSFNLFRRAGIFYTEDPATGQQTSLRTKDETEAKSPLNARNEAQRQPVLNLHLARAYLTASAPPSSGGGREAVAALTVGNHPKRPALRHQ